MKNKEYHHGGFQQQSPQCLVDRYEHMNRRRNRMIMRLKAMQLEYCFINKIIFKSNTTNMLLYLVPLQFSRQEWAVAPSIFNIKVRELAHCLYWLKLS